jgi:iron complex outermembrane receptor protein
MSLNYKTIVVFLLLVPGILVAQRATIQGRIVDENNQPLAGANVILNGTILGASSDDSGAFQITNVPSGSFTIIVSVIGFKKREISVIIEAGDSYNIGVVQLSHMALKSEPIVVTASKYEQNIQDVPASISTIAAQEISERNAISIDQVLKYVSGIHLNASQISIRNSTGYSKGLGSRVMMLVDGLPYLTGDTKDIIFESLQINDMERVEIVKGAGSALYGSSAVGGVINVISKDIPEERQYGFRIYGGFYSKPHYPEWDWSDRSRFLSGLSLNYSNKINRLGYSIGASHDQDDSYKKNDWMKRYHLGAKLEFDITPFKKLSLAGNYMYQKRANFLYWKNLNNALVPPDDQLDDRIESQRSYINTSYRHILGDDQFYSLKAIWFHNNFDDNIEDRPGTGGNDSRSDFIDGEFQYNVSLGSNFFTAGLSVNYDRVASNIFGDQSGRSMALYIQDEIDWSDRFITTLGLRVDYFDVDSVGSDYQTNPKLALLYKLWSGAALRSSIGRGFRAPSIAEAFTSTLAGGLRVIPNLELKPERSISYEFGINQIIYDNIYFDLAVFYNRFWDLIEGTFIESGDIQFRNVTDAKISGLEANFSWTIIPEIVNLKLGYTYSDPINLTQNEFLTYRPRHLFYTNVGVLYKIFKFAIDYRFMSRYDKIDENFALVIEDAEQRVDAHVVDVRLSSDISSFIVSLQINNLLLYHYVDVIGSIAKTRQFILSLSKTF